MTRRALLTILVLLWSSALSVVHAKGEDLTALHVAPIEAKFGLAVRGLNSHAQKARALGAYMKQVGLDAPRFERLTEELAEALDAANGKTAWPESMGLQPNGAIALYGLVHDDKLETILVLDIDIKKDFVRFMRRRVESDQWVEAGQKPKRAVSKRSSVKGTDQFTVSLQGGAQGQPVLTVRFKGGVAALSRSVEPSAEGKKARRKRKTHVLDHVAWSGTPMPPAFAGITSDQDRLSVGVWARPAELKGHLPQQLTMLESVTGLFVLDSSGVQFEGALKLAAELEPFNNVVRPSSEGANARRAMLDVAAGSPAWGRVSLSSAAGLELFRSVSGKQFDSQMKEARKQLGVDPVKGIAKLFTGDVLYSCHDGLADCVLALGVSNTGKAERTIKALFKAVSKHEPELHFEHDRRAVPGAPKGSVLLRTNVFTKETKSGDRRRGKAHRTDYAQLSWGVRPDLVIVGFTPQGVKRALRRVATAETTWTSPIAGKHNPPVGFDDRTSFAAAQSIGETSTLLRQFMAAARHSLPAKEWSGIAVRSLDALSALYDRTLNGTTALRGEGLDWTLSWRVETLPSERDKGYDPALDKAYRAALKHRYEGRIRSSNEALLELATTSPDSPWGKKARLLVLGGDTQASLFLLSGATGVVIPAVTEYLRRAKSVEMQPPVGKAP
jgi:hypothetical protein